MLTELAGEGAAIDTAGYEIGQPTTAANGRAVVRPLVGDPMLVAHDARMAGISYASGLVIGEPLKYRSTINLLPWNLLIMMQSFKQ